MRDPLQADRGVVAIDFVGFGAAVGDHAAQADIVILRLGVDRGDDAVHRENGVEIIRGDDQRARRVLQRSREAAANDVAKDVENDDIGVVEQAMLLEQLDSLARPHNRRSRFPPAGRPPPRT